MENVKIALLFAGQGSQYPGMGKDFYDRYDYVRTMYEEANQVLGYDLTKICFEPNGLLNQTRYTQPAILVNSLATYEILKREFGIRPAMTAGFSLGEYSALHACGVFDYTTILNLIRRRAEFMEEAALTTKGGMAAIIGLGREDLSALCREIGGVSIANYNCPGQLAVSGFYDRVTMLADQAKAKGAKRAIMLNVSGGFHTELMHEAALKLYQYVMLTRHHAPQFDIIMNCNASVLEIEKLPELMKKQIESSVYFEDTIRKMIEAEVGLFIEVGPGSVLSGFVRKIDPAQKVKSIDKLADLEGLK
jgi:[acyl-carrier-protein] S-malonyltransferase